MSILDGSNYLVWKNQMRTWLRSNGLWRITNRNEKKFQELDPSASAAAREANYKQHMDWDNKDDQAYGTILLRVNPSIAVIATSSLTAKEVWEALHTAFGTMGPSAIFADFKNAISKKIFQKRQVYELVDLPPNRKVIGNRWVLNQKMDGWKRELFTLPHQFCRIPKES